MPRFSFKVGFWNQEVDIAREMISYRGKTIPSNSITGIGISFVRIGQAVGIAAGGILGGLIMKKITGNHINNIETDISKLPQKAFGQLLIVYTNTEQKQKVLRIPVSTKDEMTKNMLQEVARTFKDKFIGFGPQTLIEKALQIKQKLAIIFGVIIFMITISLIAVEILLEEGVLSS